MLVPIGASNLIVVHSDLAWEDVKWDSRHPIPQPTPPSHPHPHPKLPPPPNL